MIVHIGTHKTGSSSFQKYLQDHLEELRDHGYHVFRSTLCTKARPCTASEIALLATRKEILTPLRCLMPDYISEMAYKEMLDVVESEIARPEQIVLISEEELSLIRFPPEVSRLKELFKDRDVEIIAVIREKITWLESWKKQMERLGLPSQSKYPDSVFYTQADSWLVDFDSMIKTFINAFGEANVTIISYEAMIEEYESIVPALCKAIGLPEELTSSSASYWHNCSTDHDRQLSSLPQGKPKPTVFVNKVVRKAKKLLYGSILRPFIRN